MAEDDYDLMPHREIVKLKGEIKELREALAKKGIKRPSPKEPKPKKEADVLKEDDVSPSIEKLSESINNLLELFKAAGEEIKVEEHHKSQEHLSSMNSHLDNLNTKIETLIKHNEEMAKGILVVAEMMKEHLPAINDNTRTTLRRTFVQEQVPPEPVQRPTRAPPVPPPPRPMFAVPEMPQPPPIPTPLGQEETPVAAPKKRDLRF